MKRQKRITPLPLCLSVLEKVIPDFFDHGWPKQRFGQPHEFLGSFSDIPWARPGSVRVPGAFGTAVGRENTKRAGGIRRHVPVPHTARFSTGRYPAPPAAPGPKPASPIAANCLGVAIPAQGHTTSLNGLLPPLVVRPRPVGRRAGGRCQRGPDAGHARRPFLEPADSFFQRPARQDRTLRLKEPSIGRSVQKGLSNQETAAKDSGDRARGQRRSPL